MHSFNVHKFYYIHFFNITKEENSHFTGVLFSQSFTIFVFDAQGHGVDFVFRYCNDEMAVVEGVPVSEMLNRSFYEVFENGDKKWLVTYADVALNGNKHILQDYSPEIDKTLTIYCFQPAPGYCACVLIPA